MGLFLGAGAVWSPSAHWAYLALSGEVDRERKKKKKKEILNWSLHPYRSDSRRLQESGVPVRSFTGTD